MRKETTSKLEEYEKELKICARKGNLDGVKFYRTVISRLAFKELDLGYKLLETSKLVPMLIESTCELLESADFSYKDFEKLRDHGILSDDEKKLISSTENNMEEYRKWITKFSEKSPYYLSLKNLAIKRSKRLTINPNFPT